MMMVWSGQLFAGDYLATTKTLDDHIKVGGQLNESDVQALADAGVQHVINLRTQAEMDALPFDEQAVVTQAKMTYDLIPLGKSEGFNPKQLATFTALMSKYDDEPTVLHCRSGYRANLIYAAWLIESQNTAPADAKRMVHAWSDEAIGQLLNKKISTKE